ncbi:M28 family peptidase [Actinosynnema sp. NPDC047251]|uniref:Peptidase, M28 family n=1 Tax=Saccharothrix espanaensis (strain ATCC 51144 / DSM 44229 / JCM 9112 / NBRC 15066 / NRRL 15764) TaxID=1179773 RepID=K0K7A3_SACES|nr:M28 family peptidase [Saccharothrix espanaensis]CCH32483.1 Peptidase, M28 family [Saccharothrix espanaensis DSM 44229]
MNTTETADGGPVALAADDRPGTLADVLRVTGEVSAERLMAVLAPMARWTKHAGTPEELDSLAYLRGLLDELGFTTEVISHDAYISLPVSARVEVAGESLTALAVSFSQSTHRAGLTGRLVAVGRGAAADYDGLDVAGCVVLVDGVPGPDQTIEAGRRGAIAQVHVSPHDKLHEMCVSPVWGSPGDDTVHQLPATAVCSVSAADGVRLRQVAAAGGEVTVHTEIDTGWRPTPILIADLAGDDEPFVFFTGHHDTWHHGLMDNGTANATMVEVARIAAAHRDRWRRGLRLAFWSGHSQGRYSGSAWYADHHWEELEDRAVVHVNIDSTGGNGNTVVADATSAAELGELAREALGAQADQEWAGRRMHRAGDQSFWGIGVPAIFANLSEQPIDPALLNAQAAVFGGGPRKGNGTGWWWHTPEDTLDKIDPELLARDTRIYLHAVWRLLTDPALPLDFTPTCDALAARLRELQAASGGRLDLSVAVDRALRARDLAATLWAERGSEDVDWFNSVVHRLSRLLVPLDYTRGDRFRHDPAVFVGGLPGLADAPRLAALDPSGAEFRFLHSRLLRERNRVAVSLRQVVAFLEEVLG